MLKNYPHPLVIKYIDSFRDRLENTYLVTEYAESIDLLKEMEDRFKAGKTFSEEECQNIILQLCIGLLHMQKHNFIHRDIKPANILLVKVSPSQTLYKIGDPGLAKNMDSIVLHGDPSSRA